MYRSVQIAASDGYPLAADVFEPETPHGPVVVINGAMGVRRRFYRPFAEFLRQHGMTVVIYDYRGIGESRPRSLRRFDATIADWGQRDFDGVLRWVAGSWAGRQVSVVGHSIGGQIIGQAGSAGAIGRVLLVASQSGYWRHWRGAWRPAMWTVWHVLIPALVRLAGLMPMALFGQGENLPRGVALQWAHWGRRPRYLFDPASGVDTAGYRRLQAPMRALSFADDPYAPLPAVEALTREYAAAQVEHCHIEPEPEQGIGHFGFFRGVRKDLWRDSLEWLALPAAPRARGALA